jgi:exosortase B
MPTRPAAITLPDPGPAGMARDRLPIVLVVAGLLLAYVPTYHDFLVGPFAGYAQGHELLVLAVVAFLFIRRRDELSALPDAPRHGWAMALLALGVLLYAFGRSQLFLRLELLSQVAVLAAVLVGAKGFAALRMCWFPLVFLLFAVPLPHSLVLSLTGPLKAAASAITTSLLAAAGYPIGRSGVVITIGQYELLVATACAGLQTMFTLEALSLLYVSLKGHASWVRNALLAALAVPVAFVANVIRVMVLSLVTYHFGDAVGRGVAHGFAGLGLFAVALLLIMALDRALGWLLPERFAR